MPERKRKNKLPKKEDDSVKIDLTSDELPDIRSFPITTTTTGAYTNIKDIDKQRFFDHLPGVMPDLEGVNDLRQAFGKVGSIIGATYNKQHKWIRQLHHEKKSRRVKPPSTSSSKKSKKGKEGVFPHQVTIWITIEPKKNVAVMVFNNGTLNITGTKVIQQTHKVVQVFFKLMWWMQTKYGGICTLPEVMQAVVNIHMVDLNMRLLQKLGKKSWQIEYFRDHVKHPGIKVDFNEEQNANVVVKFPYTAPVHPERDLLIGKVVDGKIKMTISKTSGKPFDYKMQKSGRNELEQKFIVHPKSIIQSGTYYFDVMPVWYEKFMMMLKGYLKWVETVKQSKVQKMNVDDFLE